MTALKQLHDDLWVCAHPLPLMGTTFGTRTTIVRHEDGLWVHSPGPLAGYKSALDGLGPVRQLVAPNLFHHMFMADHIAAYPDAKVYLAPGLGSKTKHDGWRDQPTPADSVPASVDALFIEGLPKVNETVFLHRPSRTLIITDLVFNFRATGGYGLWTRLFLRLFGAWDRTGPSRLLRSTIKDKAAARRGIDALLDWDFDRVTLCHGDVLETGGKDAIRQAFAYLS